MNGLNRDTFIEKNMGLVGMVVKRYIPAISNHPSIDSDDLKQVGAIGLLKAYDKFDPSYGVKFSTYATFLIDGEIRRYLRDNADFLKTSRQIKIAYGNIYNNDLLDEEPEIIADKLNIPIEQVKEALEYGNNKNPRSLHQPITDKNGKPLYIKDTVGYEVDFDSNLEIELLLKKLNQRERKIVKLRMEGVTQREIGKQLGVSQVEVSRILKRIKKNLEKGVSA